MKAAHSRFCPNASPIYNTKKIEQGLSYIYIYFFLNCTLSFSVFFHILFNLYTHFLVSGLQVIFPDYLQEKFVQSALSYIMCNGEGEYVCSHNLCICQCADDYPQCNCPITDIQIMENTLLGMSESWVSSYKDFENSGKLGNHVINAFMLMLYSMYCTILKGNTS